MKLILPILLMLIGIGGGVGAGLALMPEPEIDDVAMENPCGDMPHDMEMTYEAKIDPIPLDEREYARMNNQFVVPVVTNERVTALMVMSLSIEVATGGQEAVFSHEPRLRDAFLQVMFDLIQHASIARRPAGRGR